MAQPLMSEQIRELNNDEIELLAWRVYCEHVGRLERRRRQIRPMGIALNLLIAGILYAYFGPTAAFGVGLCLMAILGVVVDHMIHWYSPQYLLARAEYLIQERERKALVAQMQRDESARRWATLKRWLLGGR